MPDLLPSEGPSETVPHGPEIIDQEDQISFALRLTMERILLVATDAETRAEILGLIAASIPLGGPGDPRTSIPSRDQIAERIENLNEVATDLRLVAARIVHRSQGGT